MNIYNDLDNLNINKISYYKAIQNKILHYKYFYKIIYNVGIFTINTIIINVETSNLTITKEQNLYKISFQIDPVFLEKIKIFETELLENFNSIINKKIASSFNKYTNKLIYTTVNPRIHISLRISGIWESETHIGITCKLSIN